MNRFWEKVEIAGPNECWEWTACLNDSGYGIINIGGKAVRAHRLAWELHHGHEPGNFCVLHRCDNPACVNPKHLHLGTKVDNNKEMADRCRAPSGEKHWKSKLTSEQVSEIKRRLHLGEQTQREIAKEFDVHWVTIQAIKTGRTWKHIEARG